MSDLYLVDDHAMVRDGLRAVLESAGHRVLGESDQPTQALADILRLAPQVLLLDLHLGTRSGLELLEALHKRSAPVRTIVLTMSLQPRHVTEALRLGALGYVLKGSPSVEVLRAVAAVAAGQRHLAPEAARMALDALAQPAAPRLLDALSAREQQVIRMVVRGQTSAAIGEALHLSPKTVESYRSRLMAKLGVGDLPALVRLAIREGLIDVDEDT